MSSRSLSIDTLRFSLSVERNDLSSHLVWYCVVFTFAAASEYWLLNFLRYSFNIKLAVFCAILQNASWPIQLIYYLRARQDSFEERHITQNMLRTYGVLGTLNAVIGLTRTIGLTTLPPTMYVIAANTEIIFEAGLTAFILRRPMSIRQIASMLFVISGVLVSLYDPKTNKYGENENVSQHALVFGFVISLVSRFVSALNAVLADRYTIFSDFLLCNTFRYLGKDRTSHLVVLECSLSNSIVPFCLLPLVLLFLPEYEKWDKLIGHNRRPTAGITILCITIALAKYADRTSKFSIISKASTMFFAVVDSNMKIVAGIGAFLFFKEKIYWPQVVGFVLIFLSLLIAVYDKKLKHDEEQAMNDDTRGISMQKHIREVPNTNGQNPMVP